MEFIFKNFDAKFALINEQHYANLEYWLDATDSIKDCIIKIINYQEDQKKLKMNRFDLAFGMDISMRHMLLLVKGPPLMRISRSIIIYGPKLEDYMEF